MTAGRVQIQQFIINLLHNSCGAVAETEHQIVSIGASKHDSHIFVGVHYTGSGVPEDNAKDLFDGSISTKPSGSGIGLSICRTIVEARQGLFWLENSGPLETELHFSITLPDVHAEADKDAD